MPIGPQLYLAAEVAELLGVSLGTLPAKWRRLNRQHGFPRPLPGRSDAWSRVLVDEWIATPAEERERPGRTPRREASIARQRENLEARYATGAR